MPEAPSGGESSDVFATRIAGDSMRPLYQPGDIIVCSASAKVEDGCDCFVRLEPDHESTFKRVYFRRRQTTRSGCSHSIPTTRRAW